MIIWLPTLYEHVVGEFILLMISQVFMFILWNKLCIPETNIIYGVFCRLRKKVKIT